MPVDGDRAAVRSIVRGHHRGEILGIPATGAPIRILVHDFHRIEGGAIAQTYHVEDVVTFLFRIGTTPPAPAE